MQTTTTSSNLQNLEARIAQVLEHRYGDGMVYLPKEWPEQLLSLARQFEFIDEEGYLTRKGRTLLARYQFI